MKTELHKEHILSQVSWNSCRECRADTERKFLSPKWPGYQFAHDYLAWAKLRLEAIRTKTNGGETINAVCWHNDFRNALDYRITLKAGPEVGRKYCDSYLKRLGQFPRNTNAEYLRQFAKEGASCLKP